MTDKTHDAQSEMPPLPEWSKRDDLGGLVPSEIRQALREYGQLCRTSDRDAPFLPNWANYRQGVADGRGIALEEAASICETAPISFGIEVWRSSTKKDMTVHMATAIANAIRALKGDEK